MRSWAIFPALTLIFVGWRMNLNAWPWHLILQWASGLAAFVIAGVTITFLYREHSKSHRAGADDFVMFLAVLATSIMTLSTMLNFIIFIIL